MFSCFGHVHFFVTPWTVAHQFPLSVGFPRQEYWSGLPCPPPGDLPNPGIELASLMSPPLTDRFFTTSATWVAQTQLLHVLTVRTGHGTTDWFQIGKGVRQGCILSRSSNYWCTIVPSALTTLLISIKLVVMSPLSFLIQ